jgi:Zn-dependent metalloprotease
MPRTPEMLKEELGKIRKKLVAIDKEVKKHQSKSKIALDIGVKKDAKTSEEKVRDLLMEKRELKKLQEKVEKELKAVEKKAK